MEITDEKRMIESVTQEIRDRARMMKEQPPIRGGCNASGDLTGDISLRRFKNLSGMERYTTLHRLLLWRSPSNRLAIGYRRLAAVPLLFLIYRVILRFHPRALRIAFALRRNRVRERGTMGGRQ